MEPAPSGPGRLSARETAPADLEFVLAAERDPGVAPYVLQWTAEQHAAILADASAAHWIFEAAPGGRRVGYAILRGVGSPDGSVELKRIALVERDRGHGREALRLIQRAAFERWKAHRLWLDVMEHNARARHLYLSEGFTVEGVLRECLRRDGRYVSLLLMSILEDEYRAREDHARSAR
jgi:RimJ/RimL family protein N-acetyltransferase